MTVTGVIVPLPRAAGAGARLESGTKACAGDAAVAACAAGCGPAARAVVPVKEGE